MRSSSRTMRRSSPRRRRKFPHIEGTVSMPYFSRYFSIIHWYVRPSSNQRMTSPSSWILRAPMRLLSCNPRLTVPGQDRGQPITLPHYCTPVNPAQVWWGSRIKMHTTGGLVLIRACDIDKKIPAKNYTLTAEDGRAISKDLCEEHAEQIGRASCRERRGVWVGGVAQV